MPCRARACSTERERGPQPDPRVSWRTPELGCIGPEGKTTFCDANARNEPCTSHASHTARLKGPSSSRTPRDRGHTRRQKRPWAGGMSPIELSDRCVHSQRRSPTAQSRSHPRDLALTPLQLPTRLHRLQQCTQHRPMEPTPMHPHRLSCDSHQRGHEEITSGIAPSGTVGTQRSVVRRGGSAMRAPDVMGRPHLGA